MYNQMRHLLNQGVLLYVMLAVGTIGVLSQLTTNRIYYSLRKASQNMQANSNGLLRQIKLKYENCYRVNNGVHNISAFVDKYFYQYRFCGLSLKNLKRVWGHAFLLVTLLGVTGVLSSYYFRLVNEYFWLYAIVWGGTSLLLLGGKYFWNENYHKTVMMTNLMDYLENTLAHRMQKECEAAIPAEHVYAARRRRLKNKDEAAEQPELLAMDGEKKEPEKERTTRHKSRKKSKVKEVSAAVTEAAAGEEEIMNQEAVICDVLEEFFS